MIFGEATGEVAEMVPRCLFRSNGDNGRVANVTPSSRV